MPCPQQGMVRTCTDSPLQGQPCLHPRGLCHGSDAFPVDCSVGMGNARPVCACSCLVASLPIIFPARAVWYVGALSEQGSWRRGPGRERAWSTQPCCSAGELQSCLMACFWGAGQGQRHRQVGGLQQAASPGPPVPLSGVVIPARTISTAVLGSCEELAGSRAWLEKQLRREKNLVGQVKKELYKGT